MAVSGWQGVRISPHSAARTGRVRRVWPQRADQAAPGRRQPRRL